MSAYIVNDEVINRIVSHMHFNHNLAWLRRKFVEVAQCQTTILDTEIGAALFAMNVAAVEALYGKGEASKFRPLNYRFKLVPASAIKVYHDAAELMRQCAEGDIPESALYKLLTQLKAAVADSIISNIADDLVSDIGKRTEEMTAELLTSLCARCEKCCRGIEHDDAQCGAPTARRLLVGINRTA